MDNYTLPIKLGQTKEYANKILADSKTEIKDNYQWFYSEGLIVEYKNNIIDSIEIAISKDNEFVVSKGKVLGLSLGTRFEKCIEILGNPFDELCALSFDLKIWKYENIEITCSFFTEDVEAEGTFPQRYKNTIEAILICNREIERWESILKKLKMDKSFKYLNKEDLSFLLECWFDWERSSEKRKNIKNGEILYSYIPEFLKNREYWDLYYMRDYIQKDLCNSLEQATAICDQYKNSYLYNLDIPERYDAFILYKRLQNGTKKLTSLNSEELMLLCDAGMKESEMIKKDTSNTLGSTLITTIPLRYQNSLDLEWYDSDDYRKGHEHPLFLIRKFIKENRANSWQGATNLLENDINNLNNEVATKRHIRQHQMLQEKIEEENKQRQWFDLWFWSRFW